MNEVEIKIASQKVYCESKGCWGYSPTDGVCGFCGRQIYERITLERAESEMVTGCPFCNRSFVE